MQNFSVNRLRSYSAAAPRKVPFPIRTTLTTVLHYYRLWYKVAFLDRSARSIRQNACFRSRMGLLGSQQYPTTFRGKIPPKKPLQNGREQVLRSHIGHWWRYWRQISQTDSMQGILSKKCKIRSKWVEKRSRDLLLEFWDPSVSRKPLNLEISNLASV